jgi:hypothetical protein
VLWLRWRLTRNQWARGGGIRAALAAIVAIGALVLSAVGLGAGLIAGIVALGESRPMVVMVVWLGLTAAFLFFWLIGLITELQRSETIDLQRLMHLPVRLGQLFVVNYLASHLSTSVILFVPAAIGLSIGLAISRGPAMLLLIPLALGMMFMVTAWTYLLRGWLATLMSNPRRRRAIVMGLTAGLVLLSQAPNLYFNVIRRPDRAVVRRSDETREQRSERQAREADELGQILRWQAAVPPFWVPVGAQALAEGRPLPAVLGFFGVIALGAVGLRRAYTSTLHFYQGETGGRAASARSPSRPRRVAAGRPLVERRLPRVPGQAAAVALATFQSMLRAPEVKMQWGASFLVTLLVGSAMLFRTADGLPAAAGPFIATAVVVFSMFLMVGFVGNQFGFDRDGFRALVLSPADRWTILLGKNLAVFPAAAASATLLVLVLSVWLRLSPLVFVASLLQLVAGVLVASTAGNLMSILVPYRIQPGSMKPTKLPGTAIVLVIVAQLTLPAALSPVFLAPGAGFLAERAGGPPAGVVNLLVSMFLASITAVVYWRSLAPLGRLLRRRETAILRAVSADVE